MAKIEMTEEMAEQLKGLLPISTSTRQKFTPSIYKSESFPKQFAPVFVLRPMTKSEKMSFVLSGDDDRQTREDVIFDCIESAENIWDVNTRQKCDFSRDIYEALRIDVVGEIQTEILKLSGLLAAEKLGLK